MSSASGLACYRKNGQHPCGCGCGEMTYRTWASGHHWRGKRGGRPPYKVTIIEERRRKAALRLDPNFMADKLTKLLMVK